MRGQVEELLKQAILRVLADQGISETDRASAVQVIPSKSAEHGDFACNAALGLARQLEMKPSEVAERIVARLEDPDGIIERSEIAGPGYINLFLVHEQWQKLLIGILSAAEAYGHTRARAPEQVQVEFVSANPTGPLTIGHGRNAVLGDAIARLLEATGHRVTREYYFNNAGRQMRVLADSLRARYEQVLGRDAELPEDGYQGEYLVDIARELAEAQGEAWLDEGWETFKDRAEKVIFEEIRGTLDRLGIHFDVYSSEGALYDEGRVEATLERLSDAGLVFDSDGARWLRATELGLGRDRVLIKSSSDPTYLLPDIAYHSEKLERGFDRIIDVLGPDHLEQFPYVKSATSVLDPRGDRIEVVVYQWVNLRKGDEKVKMSTRKASFVTIDEVLEEVGPDVFRYFMLERRADTHLDFDFDLAKDRSERNPVFKIQYAHARMSSIERLAEERGVRLGALESLPLSRLESPQEHELCKRLGRFPEVVSHAADAREPQEVARYLLDLASAFHTYISDGSRHRVLSDDAELSVARLALVRAVRLTLGNGLRLLGIGAPERM